MGWISLTGKVGLEWSRRRQLSQTTEGKAFQMMEIVPAKAQRKNGSGPQGAASKQRWLEQSSGREERTQKMGVEFPASLFICW